MTVDRGAERFAIGTTLPRRELAWLARLLHVWARGEPLDCVATLD